MNATVIGPEAVSCEAGCGAGITLGLCAPRVARQTGKLQGIASPHPPEHDSFKDGYTGRRAQGLISRACMLGPAQAETDGVTKVAVHCTKPQRGYTIGGVPRQPMKGEAVGLIGICQERASGIQWPSVSRRLLGGWNAIACAPRGKDGTDPRFCVTRVSWLHGCMAAASQSEVT